MEKRMTISSDGWSRTQHRVIRRNGVIAAISALLFLEFALCIGCGPSPPSANEPPNAEEKQQLSTSNEKLSDADRNVADIDPGASPLELAIISPELRNDGITLMLQITNRRHEPIIWDQEFSVFLTWQLSVDEERDISAEPIRDIQLKSGELPRERFVTVQSGQSLRKNIELTKSVRLFWHARGSVSIPDGGSEEVPVAGEQVVRYIIPERSRVIRISVQYDGDDSDARDGFAVYFRQRPETVGFARGKVRSNVVHVKLK